MQVWPAHPGARRAAIAAAVLGVSALAGGSAPRAHAAAPLRVGLATAADDDVARRAGIRHVRLGFPWARVQPRRGEWRWGEVNRMVRVRARRGITVLPVLLGGPAWHGPSTRLPDDPGPYAEWVAAVAGRYGPGGRFWKAHPRVRYRPIREIELWNEPYFDYYSLGGVNPERYARLVRAAGAAGRAANPRVRFLISADRTNVEPRASFIDRMYAAVPDLNSYFDGVAIHPYSNDRAPDQPRDPWGFQRIRSIRARFVAHGAGDKPLLITEVGWATCPRDPEYCVSERRQAAFLRRAYQVLRTRYSYVRAVYFYTWRDERVQAPADRHGWFGVLRRDGRPKPALRAIRAIAARARRLDRTGPRWTMAARPRRGALGVPGGSR